MEQNLLNALPLSAHRQLAPRELITLVYHVVAPDPLPHLRNVYPSKTPDMFEQDLLHLKRHYSPVSYDQVAAHFSGKTSLPPDAVLVTFDDGYAECFSITGPLLKKHGVPCVFFLISDVVDNREMFYRNKYSLCAERLLELHSSETTELSGFIRDHYGQSLTDRKAIGTWLRSLRLSDEPILDEVCTHLNIDLEAALHEVKPYLTVEQVRALAGDGFTIGAHSRRHPKFQHLAEDQIRAEITGSVQAVKGWTGQREVPFSFPFSGQGVSREMLADLRREQPDLGLFFDSQGVRKDRPFIFHRVWADPPPPTGQRVSNLDELLHQAYVDNMIWRRQYYWQVGLERLRSGPK